LVDLNLVVSTLHAARQELAKQLEAIDKAIVALTSGQPTAAAAAEATDAPQGEPPRPPVPTRLKPKRVLGEAHREALAKGRRKAREAKEAAAGRAREMPDESFVPALAPGSGTQPPRLIKRQRGAGH
jgi:hypothetical protein